jgi:hypothetical protein
MNSRVDSSNDGSLSHISEWKIPRLWGTNILNTPLSQDSTSWGRAMNLVWDQLDLKLLTQLGDGGEGSKFGDESGICATNIDLICNPKDFVLHLKGLQKGADFLLGDIRIGPKGVNDGINSRGPSGEGESGKGSQNWGCGPWEGDQNVGLGITKGKSGCETGLDF